MSVGIGAYFGKFAWLSEAFVVFIIITILLLVKKKIILLNFLKKAGKCTDIRNPRLYKKVPNSFLRVNLAVLLICVNLMVIGVNTADASMTSKDVTLEDSWEAASVEADKVAVVVIPLEIDDMLFMTILTNRSITLLEELDYHVVPITNRKDIPNIQAPQVVLLYIGHGLNELPNILSVVSGEQIHLSEIIEKIETDQLIMLTNSCYGGSWAEFQAENRLIISSVNDSISLVVGNAINGTDGNQWNFKISIFDLINWGKSAPLEQVYELWAQCVVRFYETEGLDGVHPIISDCIAGDVCL